MAGGVQKVGKADGIKIYRRTVDGKQEVIPVDYNAIKKLKAPDVKLQAYDIIDVPEAGLFSSSRILPTLLGAASGGLGGIMNSAGSSVFRTTTIR
jgi:hypothetical protein